MRKTAHAWIIYAEKKKKNKNNSGLIQFFFPIFSELICFLCAVNSTLF